MAQKNDSTTIQVSARETGSSRSTRRLRREGQVPGVLYGRGQDPVAFAVEARELRHALAGSGAVLSLELAGEKTSAVVKDTQRHPVRGEIIHVDLLRVDLNQPISAVVTVELVGGEDSPGAKNGGIIAQITREVNIEALPSAIPESIPFDVSGVEVNDTIGLDQLVMPEGVTLLDETEDVVLVTVTPPTIDAEAEEGDEIETETELVGEDGAEAGASEGDEASDGDAGDDAGE